MSLMEFAKRELGMIKGAETDEMQQEMNKNILEIINIFSEQGHSGFSANYLIKTLERLLRYKPLQPLTGEDDEWRDIYGDASTTQQNKRDGSVFRKEYDNSTAYRHEGRIFSKDGGDTWYSDSNSTILITFPYTVPLYPEKFLVEQHEMVEKLEMSKVLFVPFSSNQIKLQGIPVEETILIREYDSLTKKQGEALNFTFNKSDCNLNESILTVVTNKKTEIIIEYTTNIFKPYE